MTTPTRPLTVPEEARYDVRNPPEFRWEICGFDEEGAKDGACTTYAESGYKHSECTYVNGRLDGVHTVFHPDGTVASLWYFSEGILIDRTFFRPPVGSPEPFPSDIDPSINSIHLSSFNGDVLERGTVEGTPSLAMQFANGLLASGPAVVETRYFTGAGIEVTAAGDAVLPRPD